ncbi:hypothetical protein KGA66_00655 [Actinocrinis puniceicyclus]|uniref:AAA+ ATPase domain-containing protein n=1 Tax=Actinocrinis puniceicyclus TaxID=977794 RepID=A0A8J7WIG9_9ACTN|nr:ATP-binding protein [Actinocrinis puniceicyclus]MBS2961535.1 hypothetical protein [Actinocrinis puniceicyclus]
MSLPDETPVWTRRPNPFPFTALAQVSGARGDLTTIVTPAVRRVREEVDRYLVSTQLAENPERDGGVPQGSGSAIVIAGENGTGKTHLAMEILAHLERHTRRTSQDVRRIYYAAAEGTFLELYAKLMDDKLVQRADLVDRVHEFYAEIVVETLKTLELPESFLNRLSARDIDPVSAVGRLGLEEDALLDSLRRRLRAVTENRDFGSALALLIQPELEDAVWNWLCGGRPDQTLVERGISKQIDSDRSALEALGVIALLHGRQGHRFVLVIDEIHNVILTPQRSAQDIALAFKKLLEVFRNAGAFLAVCGLPDIFAILPRDTGRVEPPVVPSALTDEDVRWYIEEMQERAFHERVLAPFDEESAGYLAALADGVPRHVIRLCFRAYEQAAATGSEVTALMLREIARTELVNEDVAAVRAEVERILKEDGWQPEVNPVFGDDADAVRADLWVPTGPDGAGCAVIVTDVLPGSGAVPELVERAGAIRRGDARREALLVVTGYLSRDLRARLAGAYSDPPLVYDRRTFSVALQDALRGLAQPSATRPDSRGGPGLLAGAELDAVMQQIERVSRQHSQSQRLISTLSRQLEAAQLDSAEQFSQLRRDLADLPRTEPGAIGAPARRAAHSLPPRLQSHFDGAAEKLAAFGDIGAVCRRVLSPPAGADSARLTFTYRLRTAGVFASIGVAQLLNALLTAFHEGVGAWLESVGASPGGPTDAQRDALRNVCNTYESLYGTVPLIQLDGLAELAATVAAPGPGAQAANKAARRAALDRALSELGQSVFRDALALTGG